VKDLSRFGKSGIHGSKRAGYGKSALEKNAEASDAWRETATAVALAALTAVRGQIAVVLFGGRAVEGQTELYDQATVGAIFGGHGAAVEADGAVGDGETEAGTAGRAIAGITDSVEGEEDVAEGIFRDTLAVIANTDKCVAGVFA
jgi:hypothetical protein